MNAATPLVANSALPGTRRPPADTLDGVRAAAALHRRVHSATGKPNHRDRPARIPVFRDGKACGLIERRDDLTVKAAVACNTHSELPPDVCRKLRLSDLVRRASWVDADHAGFAVANGVVHLSVQVDSMHGVLALRRIAAAIPGAAAIIDDLWIPCE